MSLFSRCMLVAIAICTLGLASCASPRPVGSPYRVAELSIPFKLSAQNNIVVEARVNDSDTLKLMLHSASSDVTLTEDAVRRLNGIAFGNAAKIQSWGGTSDARYSKDNRVQVGSLQRSGITIWENKNSGDGTDGKFGFDFFEKKVIEINFDDGVIVAYDSLPSKSSAYESLDIENQDGDLIVEGVCVFGEQRYPNRFLIHSGYSGGLLLDDAFVSASGIESNIVITETTNLTDSFGHLIKVQKGVIPEFSLGRLNLADVPAGFFSGEIGRQKKSVLGGAILKQFNLIFDLGRNKLYIQRRTTVEQSQRR